ncbi:MAG TPA: DUF4159 domain-containing protein, partial [Patescibacteria group bacterium]|nr:DUF4159 domain-containing protein [Patescibacteria group bacterium]
ILALARPILNPAEALPGKGPVRLVIDNGWAAAESWTAMQEKASSLIDRASRENRPIYILTTAPDPDDGKPKQLGPLGGGEAGAVVNGLRPYPWPADYTAAGKIADAGGIRDSIVSFWLSTGLADGDGGAFARVIQSQGELHLVKPAQGRLPLILRPSHNAGTDIKAVVEFPPGTPAALSVTVQAQATDGRVLDTQTAKPDKDEPTTTVAFDLPEQVRNNIGRIRISGARGAGGMLLLDNQFRRRVVGIAAPAGAENNAPLIESSFYIKRALEPFADAISAPVKALLEKKVPVIILPDVGGMPPEELNDLEKWVRGGGLLLRFAGDNMTQGDSFLTPAPIRKGGRALSGAMTWAKPAHMAPFPAASPYAGLEAPKDVTVARQLLAEPVEGIEKMTWAALEDGTPLITASSLDHGLLVLVHTTATPQWSDLALSGVFVKILQRTIALAGQTTAVSSTANGTLQPLIVLDGFGNATQPGGSVEPIAAADFDATMPSSKHPPGLYGRPGFQTALNLGARLPRLRALTDLPVSVTEAVYGERSRETELMPLLLGLAFALFLADWLAMMILQAGIALRLRPAVTATLMIFVLMPSTARADDEASKYADNMYLAYVRTGNSAIDYQTFEGLNALTTILNQRTSVDAAGIVPVDPAHDELAFFPLIYWPVLPGQQALSAEAVANVQNYLDHGGTILFDTRDQSASGETAAQALRAVTSGLDVPPLTPLPKGHVLTKSFYLLKDFPDRFNEGSIWVEENAAGGRDGVSSVIVGNHDWAGDWASSNGRHTQDAEMGLRFGVNLVMYALTGNYKNDQVHINAILQRLGE